MSERKVLNKYYPPDFDPSKIPKLKGAKANRQWSIRIMAPFNMRCNTCGEYIYKGKKFNSKKETVEDENYLGLHIFRFYIKCPRCVAEIAFKTDPESTDYALEAGATRNFEAAKTAEVMAKAEAAVIEEEEANNPMKVLENRTKQSMQEMEMIETLEELKEMNTRHSRVDFNTMLFKRKIYEEQLAKLQDEEDDNLVSSLFGKKSDLKRLTDYDDDDEDSSLPIKRLSKGATATDILTGNVLQASTSKSSLAGLVKPIPKSSSLSGLVKPKSSLAGLVKPKSSLAGLVKPKSSSQSGLIKPKSSSIGGLVKPKVDVAKPKILDADGFVRPSDPPSSAPRAEVSAKDKAHTSRSPGKSVAQNILPKDNVSTAEETTVEKKTVETTKDTGTEKESTAAVKAPSNALGLLGGAYSDSEEDSD